MSSSPYLFTEEEQVLCKLFVILEKSYWCLTSMVNLLEMLVISDFTAEGRLEPILISRLPGIHLNYREE